MNVIEIGCNIVGDVDGIGKHARMVTEEFTNHSQIGKVELFGGDTVGFGKFKMVTSFEMIKVFSKAEGVVKQSAIDYVIIEYPFCEYNPLIVPAFMKLKQVCHKNRTKIALSMHEYDRVKTLRRAVIKSFVKNSDLVYVSEPYYLEKLKNLNNNLFLRTIPNHVPIRYELPKKDSNRFVYFGLVNRTKAFYEMLEAWNVFNINCEYHLDIVTATNLKLEGQNNNVRLHYELSDDEASNVIGKATYSIVPVNPYVGFNNSSFVSTVQCGCIPIGCFGPSLINEAFIVNTPSYKMDDFVNSLIEATKLEEYKKLKLAHDAMTFGNKFTLQSTVEMMIEGMETVRDAE